MVITCKFDMGQKVRHKLNEFQGSIVGVSYRPSYIEYDVLPLIDRDAKWVSSVWIDEIYLEGWE